MSDHDERGLFSMLRDASSRATLEKYMIAHGVDPETARIAADRCSRAALRNGLMGGAAGALLALFATAPAAGIGMPAGAALGLTFGTGGTLLFSEQCRQVQDAAFQVARVER